MLDANEDIFILHGYGSRDGKPLYVVMDHKRKIRWVPQKELASEFSADEADKIIENAQRKKLRIFATRSM